MLTKKRKTLTSKYQKYLVYINKKMSIQAVVVTKLIEIQLKISI